MNHTWELSAFDPASGHILANYKLPRVMWPLLTSLADISTPETLTEYNCGEWDVTEAQARALLRPCGVEDAPVDLKWYVGPLASKPYDWFSVR